MPNITIIRERKTLIIFKRYYLCKSRVKKELLEKKYNHFYGAHFEPRAHRIHRNFLMSTITVSCAGSAPPSFTKKSTYKRYPCTHTLDIYRPARKTALLWCIRLKETKISSYNAFSNTLNPIFLFVLSFSDESCRIFTYIEV